jgi:hypothetical protein
LTKKGMPKTAEPHEWLQVRNRRWCLCCAAFQTRRDKEREWWPRAAAECPMTTPYAANRKFHVETTAEQAR